MTGKRGDVEMVDERVTEGPAARVCIAALPEKIHPIFCYFRLFVLM